jgi:hypothetical protein
MTAPAEPDTGVEKDPIAAIAATIQYRRSPSHVDRWQEVSADEFPWFGMAEVMLQKSDEELADAWRDIPEAAQLTTKAFQEIGARWLDGAEAMAAIMHRMTLARDTVEAESEGDGAPYPPPHLGAGDAA